jgi:hypothetical protein
VRYELSWEVPMYGSSCRDAGGSNERARTYVWVQCGGILCEFELCDIKNINKASTHVQILK